MLKKNRNINILKYIITTYICITFLYFIYAMFWYLKEQVYEKGYQTAVIDIARKSLTDDACNTGLLLGVWDEKYTYIKNMQCPSDTPTPSESVSSEIPDFIPPHLLNEGS